MLKLFVLVVCFFMFNVNIYCDVLKKYKLIYKWFLEMEIINVFMYFILFYICIFMYSIYFFCFLLEYCYVMVVY